MANREGYAGRMINRTCRWYCVVVLLTTAAWSVAVPVPAAPADADLQAGAKPLIDFAAWCAANKARGVGEQTLAAAKTITPAPAGLDDVATKLQAAAGDADESPAVAEKKAAAFKSAADALQAVADKPETDDLISDALLMKAVRLSPAGRTVPLETAIDHAIADKRANSVLDLYAVAAVFDPTYAAKLEKELRDQNALPAAAKKAVAESMADNETFGALAYLTRLAGVDPRGFEAGSYQPCTDVLAARTFLIRIPTHAMVAYVSIPWKWSPAKPSPALFCFAGAGKEYKQICDNFHNAVGDGPYVVVSPVTLSNTNSVNEAGFAAWYPASVVKPYDGGMNPNSIRQRMEFDLPGVLALAKAMHESANTEERICITGFSGGGLPCYGTMITSPNLIAAAAPACANYYLNLPPHGRANNVQVQQFFGEKDNFNAAINTAPGLIAQGHEAASALSAMGYDIADPVLVPNVGHAPMVQQVIDFMKIARKPPKN